MKHRTARGPRIVSRKGAGQTRTSARGIPYQVCSHGMRIQTLIFPLETFTTAQAQKWARDHNFRLRKVDVTSQSTRIEQEPVKLFTKGSFRTIPIGKRGLVKAVIGCPRLVLLRGRRPAVERKRPAVERKRVAADFGRRRRAS